MVTRSMRWDGAAKRVARALVPVALLLAATGQATAQSPTSLVTSRTVGNGFSLFSDARAAPIAHDRGDAALVGHAVSGGVHFRLINRIGERDESSGVGKG